MVSGKLTECIFVNFSCIADYVGVACTEPYDQCDQSSTCIGTNSQCSINSTGNYDCTCEEGQY